MFCSRGRLLHLSTIPSLWGGGRVVVRAVAKIVVAVTGIVTTIAPATAQSWPTRPLTIVFPFAAGSAGDVLGRILATRLSELLGQPVIFENVGGAGGMTGASRVAKAATDGYQVLLGTTSTLAVNQTFYKKTALQRDERLCTGGADC